MIFCSSGTICLSAIELYCNEEATRWIILISCLIYYFAMYVHCCCVCLHAPINFKFCFWNFTLRDIWQKLYFVRTFLGLTAKTDTARLLESYVETVDKSLADFHLPQYYEVAEILHNTYSEFYLKTSSQALFHECLSVSVGCTKMITDITVVSLSRPNSIWLWSSMYHFSVLVYYMMCKLVFALAGSNTCAK